jgi:hypothetical protein
MIIFIWFLNLGISIWNAYSVGKVWVEAKHAGGGYQFMAWMGYLMASIGFSYDILIVVGLYLQGVGKITPDQLQLFFNLGYVVLMPAILFSGYAVMFQSWANAYRNHSVPNMAIAAYNTYANIHNTFNAVNNFPAAFGSVFKALTGGSGKNKGSGLIIFVALCCILSGFIVAGLIVHYVAGRNTEVPDRVVSGH